jgi:hypothetical protein
VNIDGDNGEKKCSTSFGHKRVQGGLPKVGLILEQLRQVIRLVFSLDVFRVLLLVVCG